MSSLRVEYNGMTLFEGEAGEVTWTATTEGISLQARAKDAPPRKPVSRQGGGGGAILGKLMESMAAAKAQRPEPVSPTWTDEDVDEEAYKLDSGEPAILP